MSKYTTEVRYICETQYGLNESVGANDINKIIRATSVSILGDFPIFDEKYRMSLCSKIIAHYYTREIAYETVGLWKFKINTKLNEIMPYYNQLYKSELLKFNPLYDVDLTTSHTTNFTGNNNKHSEFNNTKNGDTKTVVNDVNNTEVNNTTNQSANNSHIDKYSDTPQGSVNFNLDSGLNTEYLSNLRAINDNNNTSENNVGTQKVKNLSEGTNKETTENKGVNTDNIKIANMEQYIENVVGKISGTSYSKLLTEFRQTFLNIDMQIIEELNNLFFGLY